MTRTSSISLHHLPGWAARSPGPGPMHPGPAADALALAPHHRAEKTAPPNRARHRCPTQETR